jgi:hypothetical protein
MIEFALQRGLAAPKIQLLEKEVAKIDRAARAIPLRHSDLYFMMK